MSTIATAQFGSSESDDDYHQSEASDAEDEAQPKKSKYKTMQEKVAERKVAKLWREMKLRSLDDFQRHQVIQEDDFMLQFQRKRIPRTKRNVTLSAVQQYVSQGLSNVSSPPPFDLGEFKQRCRAEESEAHPDIAEPASGDLRPQEVVVKKVVSFAGQQYTVEQKMDRSSRQYQNYLKECGGLKLGGRLGGLDAFMEETGRNKNVNAMQKTQSDWSSFKRMESLEEQFEKHRKDGYLRKQAFLAKVETKRAEMAQKRRRTAGETPQQW